jgi:ribonuclease BN (tRNA processing enzyme)
MRFYGPPARPRLPLYCPPGVLDRLAGLEPDVDLTAVFDPHPLPGSHRAGPFALTGMPLPHFVPNAGVRLQAGEIAVAYTGDTGPDAMLAELGRGADLFIVEATDRDGETQRPVRNLMSSAEAGRLARLAGARRLMITHFWPGNDRAAATAAASAEFGRAALTAEEGLTVELGDGAGKTGREPGPPGRLRRG